MHQRRSLVRSILRSTTRARSLTRGSVSHECVYIAYRPRPREVHSSNACDCSGSPGSSVCHVLQVGLLQSSDYTYPVSIAQLRLATDIQQSRSLCSTVIRSVGTATRRPAPQHEHVCRCVSLPRSRLTEPSLSQPGAACSDAPRITGRHRMNVRCCGMCLRTLVRCVYFLQMAPRAMTCACGAAVGRACRVLLVDPLSEGGLRVRLHCSES
ncbi:hypothetical protein C8Q80DRAFT_1205787 [Daedaleopsis nitida]|nr:hypothetical protein C8Q80DRAFT_1205744 [Daedaleopsis nitida]KAI0738500.1 hypothetical protein C8Q80DRAFT_1205787 [Daedaleopsis nitida]